MSTPANAVPLARLAMKVARVRRSFFEQDPLEVGRSLIGMELGSALSGSPCGGLIVEAEVYVGPEDRASHAWNARRTARTEVMFGPRGCAYVFQIYGMHYCFNIVCGAGRVPAAILIRALRPTFGLEVMAKNRGLAGVPANLRQLTSGPGRLAQALGIDRRANGLDLNQSPLWVRRSRVGRRLAAVHGIRTGVRINVDYAGEWAKRHWRFTLSDDRFVSV
jgi:DNA-3-methyladenine glycosylase